MWTVTGCASAPRRAQHVRARRAHERLPEVGAESERGPSTPRPSPSAAGPPRGIEEGPVTDGGALEGPAGPQPTPTPTPDAARPPAVTAVDPPSVLAAVGPATPPNVTAALRLVEDGRKRQREGQYDLALERFERSLTLDPNDPYAYYFLARLHFATQRYDQAVTFAGRAVALGSKLDAGWLGRAYELQGAAFEAVGRYADARTAYRRAVNADPLNAAARAGVTRLTPSQPTSP